MLDLESWASGSIPTRGNILSLDFFCFPIVKPLMPILALLPMLCICENLDRSNRIRCQATKPGENENLFDVMSRNSRLILIPIHSQVFHKRTQLVILALLPTLYSTYFQFSSLFGP